MSNTSKFARVDSIFFLGLDSMTRCQRVEFVTGFLEDGLGLIGQCLFDQSSGLRYEELNTLSSDTILMRQHTISSPIPIVPPYRGELSSGGTTSGTNRVLFLISKFISELLTRYGTILIA
jgi:hypothetical protein